MRVQRQIVRIDEEKCTGCGDCITACAEGAIAIVDGKARLISDIYCDGLGACLGNCPEDAITIEVRDAEAFDEEAVREHLAALWRHGETGEPEMSKDRAPGHADAPAGCPSTQMMDLRGANSPPASRPDAPGPPASALPHWPIKLGLVSPGAPFLQGAELVLIADCVPFAYPHLSREYLSDRALVIGCPKFDDQEFALNRLTEILRGSDVRSLTIVHMEVPCCFGYWQLGQQALEASGKAIPLHQVVVGIRGDVTGADVVEIE